jgi:hypothetical protein
MTRQEELFGEFMASSEENTEEFDQAFDKAVRLQEIKKDVADIEAPWRDLAKFKYKDDLIALKKEAETIKTWRENTVLSSGTSKQIPDEDRITSTTPFTQAIEKMYRHYYDKGECDFIKPDYVDAFIQKMKELVSKEEIPHPKDEMELISYLSERIEKVKKTNGRWKITVREKEMIVKRGCTMTVNSETCDKDKVTKKLCLLRKKYPLPCTIPIP